MQRDLLPINTRLWVGSLICALAVSGFVGCGGNATVDGSGHTAGANSAAGASATSGASGAGASGAGASGAGANANAACMAAADPGECEGYFPAFAHNPKTGLCEPFVYGGCGGNRNRYSSRDACLEACPPIGDDWGKCSRDSECTMVATSCCGACDPVTDRDLIAINVLNRSRYGEWYCAETPPCLPCEPVAETEQTEKYFRPVCKNARCTLLDIRESPLTKCQEDSDCVLREGARCCAECDGSGWVPVNEEAILCVDSPCSDCTSQPPANLAARCTAGRCELEAPL